MEVTSSTVEGSVYSAPSAKIMAWECGQLPSGAWGPATPQAPPVAPTLLLAKDCPAQPGAGYTPVAPHLDGGD